MSKKINFNLSNASLTNIRVTLIPATKELRFWREYKKAVNDDFNSLSNEEQELYGKTTVELLAHIDKKIESWSKEVKVQKDCYKSLLPDTELTAIKSGFNPKSDVRPDVAVLNWVKSLGGAIDDGLTTANVKLYASILGGAGKLFKITDKGTATADMTTVSDSRLRKELVDSLVNYLVYSRKQFMIGGTTLEPTFTKKVSAIEKVVA